ncbi:MAG: response regulator transcription factor [Finegoldia magna]|uniref:response regulator transcription factor n=1 Tax=Finegoldia magna TaxID=1260 RepID=UPI00242F0635|nr:response regulator transcription factor [Finegoldia magna]MBS5970627.1 response regulator transcription factor [Finegoldia magna]
MYNFSMKVLIIEDDKIILQSLKKYLENWEYEVFTNSGIDIMEDVKKINPDIILMDIILPSFNGYFWCEKIRSETDIPIIFISSKSEDLDIIMGMQMGADDYITKPFNFDVLMVKINAIMKRYYGNNTIKNVLDFNDTILYINEFRLEYKGKDTNLTKTEMLIMKSLFEAKGEIVTREKLMDKCWQNDFFIDDNTLAVNINRIRKKLHKLGLENFLLTKKYSGYYLNQESERNG